MTKARTDSTYDPQVDGLPVTMSKRASAADSTAHRSALTTPDLLGGLSTAPTAPTCADSSETEGNLAHAPTNHYAAYVVRNGFGVTMASAVSTAFSVTSTKSVRITIPSGVWRITDADAVYEIFFSTDAAPKHVATFTAAQLAAGATTRCYCTTAETPVVSGANGAAWTCDIGVVGALASTTSFAVSTAYTVGAISPVVTTGYNNVDVFVDAGVTTFTPTFATTAVLQLLPVYLNDEQGANYHVGLPWTVNLNGAVGYAKRQIFNLTTNGASVIILVASISNVTVNRIDITPTSVA